MKAKSVIRQLLRENPCDLESLKNNNEQKRLMSALAEIEEEIVKLNDDKVLRLFERFQDVIDDLNYEEICRCFERGVKFGVKFGIELAEE